MKKGGYVEGSGNVYADLGVAYPQEARAKADLAHRIVDIIEERKLTQVQAGKVLGVDQPKVSALKRGRLTDFSVERLVGFLLLLGNDVRITVTPKPRSSRRPPTLEVSAVGDHGHGSQVKERGPDPRRRFPKVYTVPCTEHHGMR
jgi:predicted XRE-type DNA-binding protein